MIQLLNPWFEERFKYVEKHSPTISIIVETEPKTTNFVLSSLRGITGIVRIGKITKTPNRTFIPVTISEPAIVETIARISGIKEISYEMPRYIRSINPFLMVNIGKLKIKDPILGEIRISQIEIPEFRLTPPLFILNLFASSELKEKNVDIIPTSSTKQMMLDINTNLSGRGVKVAVIDTGATPQHPQLLGKFIRLSSTVPELPIDLMGHGNWVTTCIGGNSFKTRFGVVEGIAPKCDLISVKCLTTSGFGTSSSVIHAMDLAIKMGADIISMSLGGPLQGGVEHDPECKFIEDYKDSGVIFVVAAGNEGPNKWTIGSPGASPYVITVGSYSSEYGDVSVFSSRGPNANWYKTSENWSEDYGKYGEDLIKPDVIAPGGGPIEENQEPIDMIYSGTTGWFDGFYDKTIDGFEAMRGTSMATPHVSGLIALLREANPNITTKLIKEHLKTSHKSEDYGYGLIKLSRFLR